MIDIENNIITAVSDELQKLFPEVAVVASHIRRPQKFPTVFIYESSNVTETATVGSDHVERHARIEYTVSAYTNESTGKRSKARTIISAVDDVLTRLGMHRTMLRDYFTENESTIFNYLATYSCLAGESPSSDPETIMIYRR